MLKTHVDSILKPRLH